MLLAGQPGLAPLGGVQLGVVPAQAPRRGRGAALRGAGGPGRDVVAHGPHRATRLRVLRERPRSAPKRAGTGGAGRPRGESSGTSAGLRRGRPSRRPRLLHEDAGSKRSVQRVVEPFSRGVPSSPRRKSASRRSSSSDFVPPAFAITTATYGSSTAPATRTQRSQPGTDHDGADEAQRADGHRDQVAALACRDVVLRAGGRGGDADRFGPVTPLPHHGLHRTSLA